MHVTSLGVQLVSVQGRWDEELPLSPVPQVLHGRVNSPQALLRARPRVVEDPS